MTICRQWAWKPNDRMKSLKQCLQSLIYTIGGDGNLLFNVGPMPDGHIEPRQVERLHQMGTWIRPNAEAVYGTRGGPFKPGKWGASTCKGNKIYLFVIDWQNAAELSLPILDADIKSVSLLNGHKAAIDVTSDAWIVRVAESDRDPIATVVVIELDRNAFSIEPVSVRHISKSLAFGKPAKASNVYHKQTPRYSPQQAFDDDPNTRWATDAGTHSAWLAVDLGHKQEIGGIKIDEHGWNRVRKFELQVSDDGNEWKTIFNGNKIDPNFEFNFMPIMTRWVRLNILEAAKCPSIWEFQVFPAKKR
jgi:alpha-L-fucosidase